MKMNKEKCDRITGLEKELAVLREDHNKDMERIEEQVDLKFEAKEKALLIDTREMQRRLDFLNGEAERLRQMQATYLPRETYNENRREMMGCINELEERANRTEAFQNNSLGRQAVMIVVVSVLVSLGMLALNFLITGAK
jgi:hypothetical protein